MYCNVGTLARVTINNTTHCDETSFKNYVNNTIKIYNPLLSALISQRKQNKFDK